MHPDDMVFVGFNSRVFALDRETGQMVWHWQARKPRTGGYVTILLDDDRLIVSVMGYLYCLDPSNGDELWFNETKGFGTGVSSIVSARASSIQSAQAQAAAAIQAAQAAAAAGST